MATERDQPMQMVTVNQAAAALGADPYTVREWLREGKLPGHKIAGTRWRIFPADLEAFQEARRHRQTLPRA